MRRTSRIAREVFSEFLFHATTARVGVVVAVQDSGTGEYKTVRLADGELLTAAAGEFRPATDAEVQARHRVAAAMRPLLLPALPAARHEAGSRLRGGGAAL